MTPYAKHLIKGSSQLCTKVVKVKTTFTTFKNDCFQHHRENFLKFSITHPEVNGKEGQFSIH